MLIISFVGNSNSGKTTIIRKLIEEFRQRNYRVGCIKHCPRGFDLDHEGKDSKIFKEIGAEGTIVESPGRIGLIMDKREDISLKELAIKHFLDYDLVLAEGFSESPGVKKIEMMRKEVSREPQIKEAVAVCSDFSVETGKPLFGLNETGKIADFIEDLIDKEEKKIMLKVNNENLTLNKFVKRIIRDVITALVKNLNRREGKIKKIEINMEV